MMRKYDIVMCQYIIYVISLGVGFEKCCPERIRYNDNGDGAL